MANNSTNKLAFLILFVIIILSNNSIIVKGNPGKLVIQSSENENLDIPVFKQFIKIDESGDAHVILIFICQFKKREITLPQNKITLNLGSQCKDIEILKPNGEDQYHYKLIDTSIEEVEDGTKLEFLFTHNFSYIYNIFYLGLEYNLSNIASKNTAWFESPENWEFQFDYSKESHLNPKFRTYLFFPKNTRIVNANVDYSKTFELDKEKLSDFKSIEWDYSNIYDLDINFSLPNINDVYTAYFEVEEFPDGYYSFEYELPNYLIANFNLFLTILGYILALILFIFSWLKTYKMPENLRNNLLEVSDKINDMHDTIIKAKIGKQARRQESLNKEEINFLNKISEIRGIIDATLRNNK